MWENKKYKKYKNKSSINDKTKKQRSGKTRNTINTKINPQLMSKQKNKEVGKQEIQEIK